MPLTEAGERGQGEDDEGSGQDPRDHHCPQKVQGRTRQQREEPEGREEGGAA